MEIYSGFITLFESDKEISNFPLEREAQLEILGTTMMITFAFNTLTTGNRAEAVDDMGELNVSSLRRKLKDVMPWIKIYQMILLKESQGNIELSEKVDDLITTFTEDPEKGIQITKSLLPESNKKSIDTWFSIARNFIGLPDEWDKKLFNDEFLKEIPYARLELDPFKIRELVSSPNGFVFEGPVRIFVTFYKTGALSLSYMFTMIHQSENEIKSPYLFSQNESLVTKLRSPLHADDLIYLALMPERKITIQKDGLQEGTLTQLAKGTALQILKRVYGWSEELSLDEIAAKLRLKELPSRVNTAFDIWDFRSKLTKGTAAQIAKDHIWEIRGIVDLDERWQWRKPTPRDSICFCPLPEVVIFLSDFVALELDLKPNKNLISALGFDRPTSRGQELLLQQQFILDCFDLLVSPEIRSIKEVLEKDIPERLRTIWNLRKDLLYAVEILWNIDKFAKEMVTENFFRFCRTRRRMNETLLDLRRKINEMAETVSNLAGLSEYGIHLKHDVAKDFICSFLEIGFDRTKFTSEREAIISKFGSIRDPHEKLIDAFGALLQKIAETHQVFLHGAKEYSGIDISKKIGETTIGFQIKSVNDDISEDRIRAQTTKAMDYNLNGFVLVYGLPMSGRVETSIQAGYHFFRKVNESKKTYCSMIPPDLLAELFRKHQIDL